MMTAGFESVDSVKQTALSRVVAHQLIQGGQNRTKDGRKENSPTSSDCL